MSQSDTHPECITRLCLQGLLCLFLMLGMHWTSAVPARAAEPQSFRALILLAPGANIREITEAIETTGGHVTHAFPPVALIGEVTDGLPTLDDIRAVHRQKVDDAILSTLSREARRAAQVWNALLAPAPPPDAALNLEAELVGDALVALPSEGNLLAANDPTPSYDQTSEFLIGRVAVSIILPESDGSQDPSTEDWTEAEQNLVLSEISAALDWWAAREPNARLTFVYEDGTSTPVNTSFEPISRPFGSQALWITEVMSKKGITGFSYFDQVRHYNNTLREALETDWAFTIFVVDSSTDSDNRFSDGYFAYAYLGGPFTVMTYGSNGYGSHNLDAVAAHEIGHIFLALDQYYSAYQPCTLKSGYLDVENQNSQYGECASNLPSVMRGQTWPFRAGALDECARGQIGWRDSDMDGILDPVDTRLSVVSADYAIDAEQPNVLTFTGSVRDDGYRSPSRRTTIINTIEDIHYRVDGGPWMDAQATDGEFDTYAEDFMFITSPLPTGELTVEVQVMDSAGNELIQPIQIVSVVDPVDAILDTTLTKLEQQGQEGEVTQVVYSGQSVSSASYVASIYARIGEGAWSPIPAKDGVFDEPQEGFTFSVDPAILGPGTHQVQAYAVDGEGNIETSPASDFITIQVSPLKYSFLPLLASSR